MSGLPPASEATALPESALMARLFSQPWRFEFFQAVGLIERWLRAHGVAADRVMPDYLRFGNRLSLAFPPSQLVSVQAMVDAAVDSDAASAATSPGHDHGRAPEAALARGELLHIRLVPAFLSLLGNTGVLPLHYTERIVSHERRTQDGAARAFLDLLVTPAVGQFYQAWLKHRPERTRDAAGRDGFLPLLSALGGKAARAGSSDPGEALAASYAAQTRLRAVPAGVMAGVLENHFGLPFALRQLLGCWQTLPPQDQARLGRHHVALGAGVLLGARLYQRHRRAELRIGPLARADVLRFLPGATGARALTTLLGQFCGAGLEYVVRPILRAKDARGCRLDAAPSTNAAQSGCLGVNAFLLENAASGDRDDLAYLLRP
jgi:type VI secretion system protein ImpH